MLTPHSLLSHGGSDSLGKDRIYCIVQCLQKYDTALTEIHTNVQVLFGKTPDLTPAFQQEYVQALHEKMQVCKALVQKLQTHLLQLKGLCKFLETLEKAPNDCYFKTLSLLDAMILVERVVGAYAVQTCANEDLLKRMLRGDGKMRETLTMFSIQPVTHAVKHYRAMLYVDCVK